MTVFVGEIPDLEKEVNHILGHKHEQKIIIEKIEKIRKNKRFNEGDELVNEGYYLALDDIRFLIAIAKFKKIKRKG